jgi:hypothetical protein
MEKDGIRHEKTAQYPLKMQRFSMVTLTRRIRRVNP